MGRVEVVLLALIKGLILVWELLTNWAYSLLTNPGDKVKDYSKVLAVPKEEIKENDTEVTYIPKAGKKTPLISEFETSGIQTMADVWKWSVKRYRDKHLLGTRAVLEEEDEVQKNMKIFKKLELGEYSWLTYEEVDCMVDNFGRGLRKLGMRTNDNVCLYAETRAEWLIAAQASFQQSLPVATLYTNLPEAGVVRGLSETRAQVVITSHELLPKFRSILAQNKDNVKTIVFMENPIKRSDLTGFREDVRIISFEDVIALGAKSNNNLEPEAPGPNTPAIIMPTSGGAKAAILTHGNMVATLNKFLYCLDPKPDDVYIAYLPLAHVLELVGGESLMIVWGVAIGYSHPNTLTDQSTMVKRGTRGDAGVLRPTIMYCVPQILDRVYKGVTENIKKRGDFVSQLMEYCIKYKIECSKKGQVTPIIDRLLFSKIRMLLGGRVRAMVSGGGELSEATHEYLKNVLGVVFLRGYGLTETNACATVMSCTENSVGRVGPPAQDVHIKLVSWGDYRVTDRPYPRGVIHIGGDNVSVGYYNDEKRTGWKFSTDDEGRHWYKTGDIGQFEADGTLRIIDRRKDLHRLRSGQCVRPALVECVLKGCPVVANVCLFCDSSKSQVVAIVCPVKEILTDIAARLGKKDLAWEEMVQDKDVTRAVLREMQDHAKKSGIVKEFEIPSAVTLAAIEWLPDSGLITATMKVRRESLRNFYEKDIEKMYKLLEESNEPEINLRRKPGEKL